MTELNELNVNLATIWNVFKDSCGKTVLDESDELKGRDSECDRFLNKQLTLDEEDFQLCSETYAWMSNVEHVKVALPILTRAYLMTGFFRHGVPASRVFPSWWKSVYEYVEMVRGIRMPSDLNYPMHSLILFEEFNDHQRDLYAHIFQELFEVLADETPAKHNWGFLRSMYKLQKNWKECACPLCFR